MTTTSPLTARPGHRHPRHRRVGRLLGPAAVFAVLWLAVALALEVTGR